MEKIVITNKTTKAELVRYINELENVVFAEPVNVTGNPEKETDVKQEAIKKLINASIEDLNDIRDVHMDAKFRGLGKKKALALNAEIISLVNTCEGILNAIKNVYEE